MWKVIAGLGQEGRQAAPGTPPVSSSNAPQPLCLPPSPTSMLMERAHLLIPVSSTHSRPVHTCNKPFPAPHSSNYHTSSDRSAVPRPSVTFSSHEVSSHSPPSLPTHLPCGQEAPCKHGWCQALLTRLLRTTVIKKVLIMSTLASKHPAFPAPLTASLQGPPSPVPGLAPSHGGNGPGFPPSPLLSLCSFLPGSVNKG